MVKFFRFLFGWVEFSFSGGFKEDFINECYKNGVLIQNICSNENGFEAISSIKTYKKLHRIAFRHGGKVRITKKHGLPFLLLPFKNRIGFLIGAVLFVFIFSFLGSFVWNIEIKGCDKLSRDTVSAYLENNNFKKGVLWSSVDKTSLAWDMTANFDEIAWAHINKIGTTAQVEILERKMPPQKADEYKLKGIKAKREVISVEVTRSQSKINVRKTDTYRTLHFFAVDIPLYFNIKKGDFEEKSTKYLTLKNKELPIGITTVNETQLNCINYDLTDKELLSLAEKKLEIYKNQKLANCEVVNEDIAYEIKDDKCVMTGKYVIKT